MANGFHIDGDGNLWIGSASTNFDNNAAFYVKTDGEMRATEGEIGGLDIEANRIKSNSYSNSNEEGFQIHSDGTAKFYGSLTANTLSATGANISGNITATDGTIGGTEINSSNIESTNFSNSNDVGYQIGANTATFHDVTITGTLDGASIDGTIDGTVRTATGNTHIELASDSGSTIKFVKSGGDFGFIQDNSGFFDITSGVNASGLTLGSATGPTVITTNAGIKVGGNIGNSNMVLLGGNSPFWGSVPANAGVTALSALPSSHLSVSNNTGSIVVNVNTSNLGDSHNHTTTNAPGGTFSDDNHGNNHGVNMSNVLNSSNNGGGTYHSHTTSAVNALATSGSSVLNLSANSGSILINHLDNDHANFGSSNLTNANVDTSHGPHNNGSGNSNINLSDVNSAINSNSTVNAGASFATNHGGHTVLTNANVDQTHGPHNNGNMTASSHFNSNISASSHYHPNTIIHDSRLLNVNANTVPGVNFINRLNPVQTNFIGNVQTKLTDKENVSGFITDHLEATAFTLTAQDVEQALIDDGHSGDYGIYLDNVDYYTEEHSDDLAEGETVKGFSQEHMIPVLVQAIKDLSATIDTLEARITTLEG